MTVTNQFPREHADRPRPARRSIIVLLLVALGSFIARGETGVGSALWFGAACVALAAALVARGWTCRVVLGAAVVGLSAGWFQFRINERPASSLAAWISTDPLAEPPLVTVRGLIVDTPRAQAYSASAPSADGAPPPAVRFEVAVSGVRVGDDVRRAEGRLRIRVEMPIEHLPGFVRAGASIELTGRLRPARRPMNPGDPARDLIDAQDGLVGSMELAGFESAAPIPNKGTLAPARAGLIALRERLHSAVLRTVLGSEQRAADVPRSRGRALTAAMLLGERDPGGELTEVESAFRRVGLMHLVAISGVNLAMLAWLALAAVRLTGDRGWIEPAVCAAVVLAYLVILPAESSILRSGIGLLVLLAAESSGRRYDRLTILGWVAVALLIVKPMDLWSLGFQLSFGVVAALIVLAPRVHEHVWGAPIRGLVATPLQRRTWYRVSAWIAGNLKLAVTASLVAWAVAMPIIAHHTGMVSVLAPLASLIVMPIAALTLWTGYAGILVGLVVPAAVPFTSSVLARLGDAAVWVVEHIDEWPGACVYLPRIDAAWTGAATAALVVWMWRGRVRDRRMWAAACVLGVWLAVVTFGEAAAGRGKGARVDVLAMGDGSCVLVRSNGGAAMIGCGTPGGGAWPRAEDLRRTAREMGAWRIRTVVIPSNGPEFWSLIPQLIEPLGVRTALVGQGFADAAADPARAEARCVRALAEHGVGVRVVGEGDSFTLGRAAIRFVGASPTRLIARVEESAGAALIAAAATHAQVQALRPEHRSADVLVLPGTSGVTDRADQTIAAVGARTVILPSGPVEARRVRGSTRESRARMTAVEGWIGAPLQTEVR